MFYSFNGFTPVVHPSSFVHPQAVVTGNVIIGKDVYVGPCAAIRGDWGEIVIKDGCNVQENCTVHMFPGVTVTLHESAHIGHGAIIHGAIIGKNCLVGMNAVVMDRVVVEDECIIGALSFVKADTVIPKRSLVVGNPHKIIKQVSDEMLNWKTMGTKIYQNLPKDLHKTLHQCEPLTEIPKNRPKQKNFFKTWNETSDENQEPRTKIQDFKTNFYHKIPPLEGVSVKKKVPTSTKTNQVSKPEHQVPPSEGVRGRKKASSSTKTNQVSKTEHQLPPSEGVRGRKKASSSFKENLSFVEGNGKEKNYAHYNPNLKELAKHNRKNSTKAEIKIWTEVLKAKKMKGFIFKRQRPIVNFIADFFCKKLNLIIEIDGNTHNFEETQINDKKRTQILNQVGLTVLRFSDEEVMQDIENVRRQIEIWIENNIK